MRDDKPRVAILYPDTIEETQGGVQAVANWLIRSLRSVTDWDVQTVTVSPGSSEVVSRRLREPTTLLRPLRPVYVDRSEQNMVPHFGANFSEVEVQRYRPRRQLTRHLQTFDLIQVVGGSPAVGLVCRDSGRPTCLQVATTVEAERQAEGSAHGWQKLNNLLISSVEKKALREAAHVFCENQWMLNYCKGVSRAPVTLSPPGIDTDFFRPLRDGRPVGLTYALSVGRLNSKRKNFEGLIYSFADLANRQSGTTRLVIAGAGPTPAALTSLISRLGMQDVVQVVPDPDSEALLALYQGASVFCLASHEEGLGVVLLEAMSCGLPVVATATEGSREVARRVGGTELTIVPCFDGVSEILGDQVLAHLQSSTPQTRASTRSKVVSQFGTNARIAPFVSVYRELLGTER